MINIIKPEDVLTSLIKVIVFPFGSTLISIIRFKITFPKRKEKKNFFFLYQVTIKRYLNVFVWNPYIYINKKIIMMVRMEMRRMMTITIIITTIITVMKIKMITFHKNYLLTDAYGLTMVIMLITLIDGKTC